MSSLDGLRVTKFQPESSAQAHNSPSSNYGASKIIRTPSGEDSSNRLSGSSQQTTRSGSSPSSSVRNPFMYSNHRNATPSMSISRDTHTQQMQHSRIQTQAQHQSQASNTRPSFIPAVYAQPFPRHVHRSRTLSHSQNGAPSASSSASSSANTSRSTTPITPSMVHPPSGSGVPALVDNAVASVSALTPTPAMILARKRSRRDFEAGNVNILAGNDDSSENHTDAISKSASAAQAGFKDSDNPATTPNPTRSTPITVRRTAAAAGSGVSTQSEQGVSSYGRADAQRSATSGPYNSTFRITDPMEPPRSEIVRRLTGEQGHGNVANPGQAQVQAQARERATEGSGSGYATGDGASGEAGSGQTESEDMRRAKSQRRENNGNGSLENIRAQNIRTQMYPHLPQNHHNFATQRRVYSIPPPAPPPAFSRDSANVESSSSSMLAPQNTKNTWPDFARAPSSNSTQTRNHYAIPEVLPPNAYMRVYDPVRDARDVHSAATTISHSRSSSSNADHAVIGPGANPPSHEISSARRENFRSHSHSQSQSQHGHPHPYTRNNIAPQMIANASASSNVPLDPRSRYLDPNSLGTRSFPVNGANVFPLPEVVELSRRAARAGDGAGNLDTTSSASAPTQTLPTDPRPHASVNPHLLPNNNDNVDSSISTTPRPRLVAIIIHDPRRLGGQEYLAEFKIPAYTFRSSRTGIEDHRLWVDAADVCKSLQSGPSRIDGPAKVYVMRGKYRQQFLRVSATKPDGSQEDNFVSAHLEVSQHLSLHVYVEEDVLMPGQRMYSPSNSSIGTGSQPLSSASVSPVTEIFPPSTALSFSPTIPRSSSPLNPDDIMAKYTNINEKYSKVNTSSTNSTDGMDCSDDIDAES